MELAHRVVYRLVHGPIPKGMFVCHRCDNPPCCNPAHLFLGTSADNIRDMAKKGRHFSQTHPELLRRGEQHGNARLTEAMVREIRMRYPSETMKAIAASLGISLGAVAHVVYGRHWTHVV